MQPSPFYVQRPHQAVAARVHRVPVRVELSAKRVGSYTLSGPALVFGVEVLCDPRAVSALVTGLVSYPQKCPPITSCLFITSTTCTEPEVSRTQLRLPLFLENSAR